MTRSKPYLATAAIALLGFAMPPLAVAQEVVQPLPGTTDADKLADTMRRLGRDPRDVEALVRAGELSIGLGDLSGAAALFARAEKLDPRNGRVKAGMASILVRSERPGEALRYFAQAEGYGLSPRTFAADRGFAYDLIGQQDRAQRDYRVALRDAPDDETIRRYALSLGISGRQDLALHQLAPLIRKTDRGAWRARAFILAMTGDVPGASYIATTMMPAGMAQGLQPFFQRLPTLAAADRAFAVHFGEVHASAERIVDARMTPPLPVLGPDASAPVMAAATPTPPVQVASTDTARGRRDRTDRRERRQPQTRVTAGRTAMAEPVPAVASPVRTAVTPSTQIVAATTPMVQPVPQAQVTTSPAPARVQPQVAQAPVPVPTTIAASIVAQAVPTPQRLVPAATAASVASADAAPTGTLPSIVVAKMSALPASPAALPAARPTTTPLVTRAGSTVVAAAPTTPLPAPGFSAPVTKPAVAAPATTRAPTLAATAPAVTTAPVALAEAPPARVAAAREDSILARIVAGLSIPASELDVAPAAAAPVPAVAAMSPDAQRVLAEAKAKTARDAAAKKILDETLAAERVADRKAAARKAAADKKASAEKKAAAEKKAIADKEAAEEKRIARANPERIWVQVSTGATEGDLPKAWKGVKAKAPAAFGGRGGWTTPWRATNRVLAGPFKTDAEARTFVNQLAKEGVSTFSFTSDAGQVITRLPSK